MTRRRLMIDAACRPRLPRHARLRHDSARGMWLLLAPERVLTPDAIAVEVLQMCDGRRIADIAGTLAAKYDAPRDEIERDVIAMLQDLADKGFLTVVTEETG